MHLRRYGPSWLVDDLANLRQIRILALSYEDRLVAGLVAEVAREVEILSGKILMYEKKFHRVPR
jgi:hypothetical protein